MISFFNEDTKEEEKLLQEILESKNDKIPNIIKEIVTSYLSKSNRLEKKEESSCVKNEEVYYDRGPYEDIQFNKNNIKEHIKYTNNNIYNSNDCNIPLNYSNEELLNLKVDTNIFPFHIKKNGKINADIFFIPYNSIDDEDVITEYTYSYNYYDIYSENIEQVNKSFHSNKKRKIMTNKNDNSNNEFLIKKEINEDNNNIENKKNINSNEIKNKRTNFQKLLVHFRGRLFIGCHINYSYFKIKTYLAMIKDHEDIDDKQNIPLLNYVNKNIQTYNLIQNATYWKQDEYPDYTDQNIQKLFFFLILKPLNNYNEESELNNDVVF